MTLAAPLTAQKTMSTLAWALLLFLAFIWGGSFVFAKVAVAEIPPFTLVLLRVGLAAATLWLICLATGVRMPRALKAWGAYAVMGLLNNVIAFSLIFTGQQEIGASLASILNGSMPFFTVLLAGLLLADEQFSPRRIVGIVIGFAGVVLIIGPRHLLGLGDHLLSELMLIGAAISYAFASVWGRRFAGQNPMATATGQLTMSTLMMIPIASLIDQPWTLPVPSLATIGSVIALAVVCTAFAYVLFFRILDMAGATNVSLVTMLVPVSATLLAVPLLGERLEWLTIIGFAVITLGLIVLDGRPVRYLRERLARA
ncbi:DMT family transporter [Ahrensia marina]|uniref:DMT family transporter n=1 Tax=Ahrensia marina TaxID=1514904 RepID=UPI0035D044C0